MDLIFLEGIINQKKGQKCENFKESLDNLMTCNLKSVCYNVVNQFIYGGYYFMQKIKKSLSLLIVLALLVSVMGVMSVAASSTATLKLVLFKNNAVSAETEVLPEADFDMAAQVTVDPTNPIAAYKATLSWDTAVVAIRLVGGECDIAQWKGLKTDPAEDPGLWTPAFVGITELTTSSTTDTAGYKYSVDGSGIATLEYVYGPFVNGETARTDKVNVRFGFTAVAEGDPDFAFSVESASEGLLSSHTAAPITVTTQVAALEVAEDEDPVVPGITSEVYPIFNYNNGSSINENVLGLPTGLEISDVVENLDITLGVGELVVTLVSGDVIDPDPDEDGWEAAGTGTSFAIKDGSTVLFEVTVVVLGDIDGDAEAAYSDSGVAYDIFSKVVEPEWYQIIAADLDFDGGISYSDASTSYDIFTKVQNRPEFDENAFDEYEINDIIITPLG